MVAVVVIVSFVLVLTVVVAVAVAVVIVVAVLVVVVFFRKATGIVALREKKNLKCMMLSNDGLMNRELLLFPVPSFFNLNFRENHDHTRSSYLTLKLTAYFSLFMFPYFFS